MALKPRINGWNRTLNRTGRFGTSIVYKKNNFFLEIFQDSSWIKDDYKKEQANVIIYDHQLQSYESAYGKDINVWHESTFKQAEDLALKYMENN